MHPEETAKTCVGPAPSYRDTAANYPRRSTIKELLAQKAKRLRLEAAKLEALSDSLPDQIGGSATDETLSEIVAAGLYK